MWRQCCEAETKTAATSGSADPAALKLGGMERKDFRGLSLLLSYTLRNTFSETLSTMSLTCSRYTSMCGATECAFSASRLAQRSRMVTTSGASF